MPLTRAQRVDLAEKIIDSMRTSYKEHGEHGDFADGERYLRNDATDQELLAEEEKWCKNV